MNPPNNRGRRIIKINAILQAQLIALLLEGTRDCRELAEETGLHYVTVLQYTRELHRAKAVHICKWNPDDGGRHIVKVYKIGKARDAKRPKMTAAERQQASRDRKAAAAGAMNLASVLNMKAM